MRIIYDNAIDRATITASSWAGVLVAMRMQSDEKAEVWRSTGTTATLTITWPAGERIEGLGGAFMNASSGQQWRVRLYSLPDDAAPALDQTYFMVPSPALGLWAWGATPLGVNSFAFGGGATGACWPASTVARKMVIDITDLSNVAGYIEIGKLFAGRYWEPTNSADYGAPLSMPELTTQTRSDSGSLRRDLGPKWRELSLSLSALAPADRERVFEIARNNGLARSLFISLYPQNGDSVLEQAHQLWGCLLETPQMSTPSYLRYATSLKFGEI